MASDSTNENSNPLAEILEMISSSSEQNASDSKGDAVGANSATQTSSPLSSDLFSTLLSNPELISKLPSIISAIKPIIDSMGRSGASAPSTDSIQASALPSPPASTPAGAAPSFPHKQDADRRAALLCAMKPYLCRERQDAIDYIIKLSKLGDILKSL